MRRRHLLLLLAGAMTAGRALHAQQKAIPVIGLLGTTSPGPFEPLLAALKTARTWSRSMRSGYNFVRIHKTLRISPAMAAGISDRLWTMEEVVQLIDARTPKVTGDRLIG